MGRLSRLAACVFSAAIGRGSDDPAGADPRTAHLLLYEFPLCPYCIKVRCALWRLQVDVARVYARKPRSRDELVQGGGLYQVPCLRIEREDGSYQWMYESADIVEYLEKIVCRAQ